MWGRWEQQLISAPVHSQSCLFLLTFRLQVGWFKSCTLPGALCLNIVTCAQIIGPMPSKWITHSAVAIWWAGIALVILIWILWIEKYEQVVNASGRRANMLFTNPASSILKACFDNTSLSVTSSFCAFIAHNEFSLLSAMGRTFIASV